LASSSFSPSAQKQEARWVYAFFLRGKKKAWQRKNFFQSGSVNSYKISLKIKKYELHGPFPKKNKKNSGSVSTYLKKT